MTDAGNIRAAFQQRDFPIEAADLSTQLATLACSFACSAVQLVKHWEAFVFNR